MRSIRVSVAEINIFFASVTKDMELGECYEFPLSVSDMR